MRIAHVTDCHLAPPGQLLFGLDTYARLDAVLQRIEADYGDVDLCVLTGDLTDTGDPAAYEWLRERLVSLPVPVRLLLGNHDNRTSFLGVFKDDPVVGKHFVQSFEDIGDTRLVYLDTLNPGLPEGTLCAERLDWLRDTLASGRDRDLIVFTHYPFLPFGVPHFDGMLLSNPGDVLPLLLEHGRVRHIFCGHAHVSASGHWQGLPFTISAGTAHHILPNPVGRTATFVERAPQFDVATVEDDRVFMHRVVVDDAPVIARSPGVLP